MLIFKFMHVLVSSCVCLCVPLYICVFHLQLLYVGVVLVFVCVCAIAFVQLFKDQKAISKRSYAEATSLFIPIIPLARRILTIICV